MPLQWSATVFIWVWVEGILPLMGASIFFVAFGLARAYSDDEPTGFRSRLEKFR